VKNEIFLAEHECSALWAVKVSSEEIKSYFDDLHRFGLMKKQNFNTVMSEFCSNCSF
jgi:hypothetical protein